MFPSIPDKFYKLLTLLGVILIGYCYFAKNEIDNKYSEKIEHYNNIIGELDILELETQDERNKLIKYDSDISKKYNVDKSIEINNEDVVFTYSIKGNKNDLIASKLMSERWEKYTSKTFKIKLLSKKLENYGDYLKREDKINSNKHNEIEILLNFGVNLFILGLGLWIVTETFTTKKNDINIGKSIQDRFYKHCQSCGMQFSSSRFYGTNKDESYSNAFCEDCYQNGEYTEPELTLEQVKENARMYIKDIFIIKKLKINALNRLERFNRNKYFD